MLQENVYKIIKDERLPEKEDFRIVTPKHGEVTTRVYISLKRLGENEILIPLLMGKKIINHYELVATTCSRGYFEHMIRMITRIVRERDEKVEARQRLIRELKEELEWTNNQVESLNVQMSYLRENAQRWRRV